MDVEFLSSIPIGKRVRLREGVYPHVSVREWVFAGVEKGDTVLLSYEIHGHIWKAKVDDIDWNEVQEKK